MDLALTSSAAVLKAGYGVITWISSGLGRPRDQISLSKVQMARALEMTPESRVCMHRSLSAAEQLSKAGYGTLGMGQWRSGHSQETRPASQERRRFALWRHRRLFRGPWLD